MSNNYWFVVLAVLALFAAPGLAHATSSITVFVAPTHWTIDSGQSVILTAIASGGSGTYITYGWETGIGPVGNGTSHYLFSGNSSTLANSPDPVTVIVTDSLSRRSQPADAFVTVNPPLSVAISPSSNTLDSGQNVLLTATASGGSGTYSAYQWELNGAPVGNSTASYLFSGNSSTLANSPDNVTVSVTDNLSATATAAPASIMVNPAAAASCPDGYKCGNPASGCAVPGAIYNCPNMPVNTSNSSSSSPNSVLNTVPTTTILATKKAPPANNDALWILLGVIIVIILATLALLLRRRAHRKRHHHHRHRKKPADREEHIPPPSTPASPNPPSVSD